MGKSNAVYFPVKVCISRQYWDMMKVRISGKGESIVAFCDDNQNTVYTYDDLKPSKGDVLEIITPYACDSKVRE